MKSELSRVYFDDNPVTLLGDEAQPPLSRIVRAGGKRPDRVDVVWLKSPSDPTGVAVGPEEIIDRTAEPAKPIYLRSVPKDGAKAAAAPENPVPFSQAMGPAKLATPTAEASLPATRNVDRVIDQLGVEPAAAQPGGHVPGVFHSPSELDATQGPVGPPAPPVVPVVLSRKGKAEKDQSAAEAEAEERQEEERDQEGTLQDAEEAADDADSDADDEQN